MEWNLKKSTFLIFNLKTHALLFVSRIFNIETFINQVITINSDLYGSAKYIVNYLNNKALHLSIPEIQEFKEMAFKALADKYVHLYEELIDVRINIFNFR